MKNIRKLTRFKYNEKKAEMFYTFFIFRYLRNTINIIIPRGIVNYFFMMIYFTLGDNDFLIMFLILEVMIRFL